MPQDFPHPKVVLLPQYPLTPGTLLPTQGYGRRQRLNPVQIFAFFFLINARSGNSRAGFWTANVHQQRTSSFRADVPMNKPAQLLAEGQGCPDCHFRLSKLCKGSRQAQTTPSSVAAASQTAPTPSRWALILHLLSPILGAQEKPARPETETHTRERRW